MNSKIKLLFLFLYLLVINISYVYSQSFDSKNLTNTRNLDNYVNKSINNDLLTKNTLRLNAIEKNLQNLWGRFETDLRDLKISIEQISNSMKQENGVSSKDLNLFSGSLLMALTIAPSVSLLISPAIFRGGVSRVLTCIHTVSSTEGASKGTCPVKA